MTMPTLSNGQAWAVAGTSVAVSIGLLVIGIAGQNRAVYDDCNKWNIGGEVIEKVALAGCPRGEEFDPREWSTD